MDTDRKCRDHGGAMKEHNIEALASYCIKRFIHAKPCIHTG
jgi:hypothetical protein